jgi:rsbT co-antagonist protein RsbR
MPRSREQLVEILTTHLAEIAAGHCSVTPTAIEGSEDDPALAQLLAGLMWLQEELTARETAKNLALAEQKEALQELAQKHRELLISRALTDELSTPIMRAGRGIVMMPLIGELDEARASLIVERLLEAVKAERARHVILDITGLVAVEGKTARYLSKIATAARFLGARMVLAGVRPTVAVSLQAVGVDLSVVRTVQDMHDALRLTLAEINQSG